MPVLFDEIPLENIGKIKMITAQGNPPFEIGAFAHWKIQCKLPPKTKRFCPLVLK